MENFDKQSRLEIEKEMLESINKMIEFNEFGISGFMKSFKEKCGNPAIFPEFFEANNGLYVEKIFLCCPWQREVLFGTEENYQEDGVDCRDGCLINIFKKDVELRLEILKRFKKLLEDGYYLNCLKTNKPIKPLLTKWEQKLIESYEDKKVSAFKQEQSIQTERNYIKNMIYIKGTEENPVNEELFGFWARFMTNEKKLEIERFKRTANTSIVHNIHWDLINDEYEQDSNGEYYYNHVMVCPLLVPSPIYRTDCLIQMSLFDCVELNQTLFHFGINSNNIILPATENLIKFYLKYKNKNN